MIHIHLSIENKQDAAYALREVANLVENGYTNGLIGCSGDSWYIDDSEQ